MNPRTSSPALRVTLHSGEDYSIPGGSVTRIQALAGNTIVECGLVSYVVRDSVLSLKLQLRHGPASRTGITTAVAPREYHA
ncbi:hypothetical protein [Haliangium sp. UPWRP_2]|uniref:hypothetical protein n=1 Tax=Haliangium sp. UPWRP_2 TaxID=1931276 RepID=UPI000B547BBF|nr:hypothetical protein [Haliangium sp. UPWRP_2]PSM32372.1 hypothetical protein BVG81_000620 [Haliangium sp. UPWRP_2]